jgi:hypothetical protein
LSDELEEFGIQLNLNVEWQLGITATKKNPQLHYAGASIVPGGAIGRGLSLVLGNRERVTGSQSAQAIFDLTCPLECFAS